MNNTLLNSILDIPHLIDAIWAKLSKQDRNTCVLVCRAWNSAFQPVFWRQVKVPRPHWDWAVSGINEDTLNPTEDSLGHEPIDNWLTGIRRHGHLVRDLEYSLGTGNTFISTILLNALAEHCTQLSRVKFTLNASWEWPLLIGLVAHNPDLHELCYIESVGYIRPSATKLSPAFLHRERPLAQILRHVSKLRRLQVERDWMVSPEQVLEVGRLCPHLRDLAWFDVVLAGKDIQENVELERAKDEAEEAGESIPSCICLKHSSPPQPTTTAEKQDDEDTEKNEPSPHICTQNEEDSHHDHSVLAKPCLPHLTTLRINYYRNNNTLVQLLRHTPQLTALRLRLMSLVRLTELMSILGTAAPPLCPHLLSLAFENHMVEFEAGADPIGLIKSFPHHRLQSLEVQEIHIGPLAIQTLAACHSARLEMLRLIRVHGVTDVELRHLLMGGGKQLQHLEVTSLTNSRVDAHTLIEAPSSMSSSSSSPSSPGSWACEGSLRVLHLPLCLPKTDEDDEQDDVALARQIADADEKQQTATDPDLQTQAQEWLQVLERQQELRDPYKRQKALFLAWLSRLRMLTEIHFYQDNNDSEGAVIASLKDVIAKRVARVKQSLPLHCKVVVWQLEEDCYNTWYPVCY
ncbi:hypothetical protein BGZ73_004324 [Actinomortierella ambigua]|nr:hypothetical protein BGZ73_004324 [Actinomortierella ambigua]